MITTTTNKIGIELVKVGNRYRNLQESQINFLMKSIKEFGLFSPILINSKNELVAGNHRLEACRRLGLKEIECIRTEETDKDIIKQMEIHENIARTSKVSMIEKCKIVYETNKALDEQGLKAKAGRRKEGEKTYTLEDIGNQVGLKKDTVNQYLRVWSNLSIEARLLAEEKNIQNIKVLEEISKLSIEAQLEAILNIEQIKEKIKSDKADNSNSFSKKESESTINLLKKKIEELEMIITNKDKELSINKLEISKLKKSANRKIDSNDYENIKILWKFASKACHPDVGGKKEDMQKINNIMDSYKKYQ